MDWASKSRHKEAAAELLLRGPERSTVYEQGWTLLHGAVYGGEWQPGDGDSTCGLGLLRHCRHRF